jgi:hypothetical protein
MSLSGLGRVRVTSGNARTNRKTSAWPSEADICALISTRLTSIPDTPSIPDTWDSLTIHLPNIVMNRFQETENLSGSFAAAFEDSLEADSRMILCSIACSLLLCLR